MSSTVKLIWKCNKPNSQIMVQLCESLMTKAAIAAGMDTAIIRKEVHSTTRVHGRYVKTIPHITGDIINTKEQKGFALHYNMNNSETQPLPDLPNARNPQTWPLAFKQGKGFVLADDETRQSGTLSEPRWSGPQRILGGSHHRTV